MSIRQQIINALATQLQNISGMATKVHIAKDPTNIATADMPCIILQDGRAEVEFATLDGGRRHRLQVAISWWATGTAAWQSVQDGMVAMLTAFNTDPTLGGLVVSDEVTAHEVFTSQTGTIDAAGLIELALTYYTDSGTI